MKVVEGPAAGMKCWLRPDQLVTVGRMSNCDFCVAEDHHMSRNHMIVEGLQSSFRVRDVGSSNGTFVNGTRISMVELCVGDRIKAGNSVFAVEFEEEGNKRGSAEHVKLAEEEFVAPIRTLSAADLSFSQEATERFVIGEEEAELATGGQPQSANPESVPERRSSDDASQAKLDTAALPADLRRHFQSQPGSLIWRQQPQAGISEAKKILDALHGLPHKAQLSLIINRDQLAKSEIGELDFFLSSGEARALTETLYLLNSPRMDVPIEFFKRCVGQDAVVGVVTGEPLEPAWILEAIDMLSYPSLLYQLVQQSPGRATKLMAGGSFLLFEPNRQGELCLLTDEESND